MYDLSIVIPTCNRADHLQRCLDRLESTLDVTHEIIVVDGASTDGTRGVLDHRQRFLGNRLKVIRESRREGFVKAANKGFRAATGRNMTWLNDDARPLPGALDLAVERTDSAPANLAFYALFHKWHSPRNVAYEVTHGGQSYQLCHVRGTLYANFCVGRRETFEQLGYFDERYYFYAADPDLSLKAWSAGMTVEPLFRAYVEHDEHEDVRREQDADRGRADNEKLFAKWDLPAKNMVCNDFNPARPCTLR